MPRITANKVATAAAALAATLALIACGASSQADPRCRVSAESPHRGEIAKRSVAKTGKQRADAVMVFGLRGCRSRPIGASVKPACEANDFIAFFGGMKPCQFDRRFICLGAGVAKERLAAKALL